MIIPCIRAVTCFSSSCGWRLRLFECQITRHCRIVTNNRLFSFIHFVNTWSSSNLFFIPMYTQLCFGIASRVKTKCTYVQHKRAILLSVLNHSYPNHFCLFTLFILMKSLRYFMTCSRPWVFVLIASGLKLIFSMKFDDRKDIQSLKPTS